MKITSTTLQDVPAVLHFYLKVAENKRGIARYPHEINATYVSQIIAQINEGGLGFIGRKDGQIIAEIHASKYGIAIFDHILTGLTIAVHPDYQKKGYGKQLFLHFLQYIEQNRPDIKRVELESRSSNEKSIGLYESIGFKREGILKNKTRNHDGQFEDSWSYAWFNKYSRM